MPFRRQPRFYSSEATIVPDPPEMPMRVEAEEHPGVTGDVRLDADCDVHVPPPCPAPPETPEPPTFYPGEGHWTVIQNVEIAAAQTAARLVQFDHVASRARIEAIREREAQQQRVHEARRAAYVAASERATETLMALLDERQREQWRRHQLLTMTAKSGRRYVIRNGYSQNIYQIDDEDMVLNILCAHPPMTTQEGRLPSEDAVIAQLLALRTDDAGFLDIAFSDPFWGRYKVEGA